MENVNENQVDSAQKSSGQLENDKSQDKVSYESYQKSVQAEKNARMRAQELESQLEQIKMQELEKAGKHEEIIESLRLKNSELSNTLNETRQSHLWDKVTGEIKTKSLEHGCTHPDKLIKLLGKEDFASLQGQDGNLIEGSIAALVEKAKKENGFLFSKGKVEFNDITPKFDGTPTKKDFSQMSADERMKELKASLGIGLGVKN